MNKIRIMALAIVAVLAALPSALAQTVTGSVTGTVADPSGAVIAGAKVALINELTKQERDQDTGASGDFAFTEIVPGTYDITITKDGFNTYAQRGIVVATSESVALHQISMQIGSVTQEVTVSAAAARVETDNGARTGLVTPDQISTMPNSGRNYLADLRTLPGVTEGSGGGGPTLSGGRIGQALVQLDGIAFADNGVQGTGGNYQPNIESIGEIKVLLSNYSAEYGARSGGQINVTTKAGTNVFHGSAYEFLKNEDLDAKNYFAKTRARDRFNNPGYTIGGPIIVPGTSFNRNKDKLFFFWSQEWLPASTTGNPSYLRLPTQAERNGDFSADVSTGAYIGSTTPVSIHCPGSATALTAAQAANMPGACGIPINASAQEYMNAVLPLPNNCPTAPAGQCTSNQANSDYVTSSSTSHNQETVRVDWAIAPSTTFFIRGIRDYTQSTTTSDSSFTCVNTSGSGTRSCSWPYLPGKTVVPSYGIVGTLIHTFTPNIVNDLTVGMNLNIQNFSPGSSAITAASRTALGITLPQFLSSVNNLNLAPYATFTDTSFGGAPSFNNGDLRYPFNGKQYSRNFADNLSWVMGNHSLKFGTYIELGLRNSARESFFNTTYSFNNDSTDPQNTNFSYANALFGIITTGNITGPLPSTGGFNESNERVFGLGRYHDFDWYLQDDWKVTRRLTVNAGVRFQYITPTWGSGQHLTNFSTALYQQQSSTINPLIRPACPGGGAGPCKNTRVGYNPVTNTYVGAGLIGAYAPKLDGTFSGVIYPGSELFPAGVSAVSQPSIGYGPRIGFAYDVFGNGKTAVRGGFGMFYDRNVGDDIFMQLLQQPPNLFTYTAADTTVDQLQSLCCSISNLYLAPVSLQASQQSYKMPQNYQYSLGVQRDMGHGLLLDVSYSGNVARHLRMQENINAVNYGRLFLASSVDPTTGQAYSGNYADILRPFTNVGGINFATFDGNSNYNSLQLQVTRRFGTNLTLQGSWTYAKVLDFGIGGFGGNSWRPYISRSLQYGPASTDRRHNVVLNWTYKLPSASKMWDNLVTREALDGWQVTGLVTFQTGAPQVIGLSVLGNSNPTGAIPGDNLATSVSITCQTAGTAGRLQSHMMSGSCISAPPLTGVTPGLGTANLKYNFTGPGLNNWDVSLFKRFALGSNETRNIELRVETYNLWNHTQFSSVSSSARFNANGTPNFVPNFGQYTAANAARTMQLGAAFHF